MKNEKNAVKVSIVEDDVKVRGSLARLVDSTAGFICVSQHPDAENALKEIPVTLPDVVLMDINLPGMHGVDCVRRLKELLPKSKSSCLPFMRIPTSFSARFRPARAAICSNKVRPSRSLRHSARSTTAARQ